MNPENHRKPSRSLRNIIILGVIILVAAAIGWRLGHVNKPPVATTSNNSATSTASTSSTDVKSLVTYDLPSSWTEASCPNVSGVHYIVPAGATLNCNADPASPVKISIDAQNSKDCNDLQNVQNVQKHICISLYINGHKTLKSTTIYSASQSAPALTINAYYIDTGKGVVKLEYVFNTDNTYQTGFDQLANSIKVKAS